MTKNTLTFICFGAAYLISMSGCVKDYLEVPQKPQPKVGVKTESLEAALVEAPISTTTDAYWKEADYVDVALENLVTGQIYTQDGLLNMTGTFNGLSGFNKGNIPSLILKAAYDKDNIYVLAEWDDSEIHLSQKNWLWNGPEDTRKPSESAQGWTSQRNDDKIVVAFDINGNTLTTSTFADVGCAIVCTGNESEVFAASQTAKIDIWNWSIALSEPFGMAFDMVYTTDNKLTFDAGKKTFRRNEAATGDDRSGPAFEWNGLVQNITKIGAGSAILDPAFFLINKTSFTGDPALGELIYADHNKGCISCHGEKGNGQGDVGDGPAFNKPEFGRKYSRQTLKDKASDAGHDGSTYYAKLTVQEQDDLIAYIRGLAGVPGYYLETPVKGESNADVATNSNAALARVETKDHGTYKVLFIRKLNTGHTDDISFDPAADKSYTFGIALMDNDGINHIGSINETLIFK